MFISCLIYEQYKAGKETFSSDVYTHLQPMKTNTAWRARTKARCLYSIISVFSIEFKATSLVLTVITLKT